MRVSEMLLYQTSVYDIDTSNTLQILFLVFRYLNSIRNIEIQILESTISNLNI